MLDSQGYYLAIASKRDYELIYCKARKIRIGFTRDHDLVLPNDAQSVHESLVIRFVGDSATIQTVNHENQANMQEEEIEWATEWEQPFAGYQIVWHRDEQALRAYTEKLLRTPIKQANTPWYSLWQWPLFTGVLCVLILIGLLIVGAIQRWFEPAEGLIQPPIWTVAAPTAAPPTATTAPSATPVPPAPPTFTATPAATATPVAPTVTPIPTATPAPMPTPWQVSDMQLLALDVKVQPVTVAVEETYWRVVGLEWLTGAKADGKSNIFVEVLDEAGGRVANQVVRLFNMNGALLESRSTNDKSGGDYACDFPMYNAGRAYRLLVDGLPSESVINLGMGAADDPTLLTSFKIKFQRTKRTQ